MNLKRTLLILIAVLFTTGAALAEPAVDGKALSVHSFSFKTKDASKAAAAIKNLVSGDGLVSIQPATNSLVVTDHPDNLKAIAKALADFDTQAQPIKISIRLVSASRVDVAPAKVPHDLEDVAAKMAMFRFNSFESAGEANVDGKEGDAEVVDLPTGYRTEFRIGDYDEASDSVKVSDFHLSRLQKDQLTSLLKTTLNLRIGQMYIVGASKTAQSQRALMIVITARR
jgi:ABC-type Na+ efflux pump permease subunit